MNKVGLKKVKRRRKLKGRVKCHGDKSACSHKRTHTSPIQVFKKKTFWQKIKEFLLKFFKKR